MKKILLLSVILFPVMSHALSIADSTAMVGYGTQVSTGDFLVVSSGYGPKMAQEILADTQEYESSGDMSILLDALIKARLNADSSLSENDALDLVVDDASKVLNITK